MTQQHSRNPLKHALQNRALGILKTVNALQPDWQRLCDFAEAQQPPPLSPEALEFLRHSIRYLVQDAEGIMALCDQIPSTKKQDNQKKDG